MPPYIKAKRYTHWGETDPSMLGDPLEFLKPRCQRYGITVAQYVDMMRVQGGDCKVCGQTPSSPLDLVIDHDHDSGTVRGLLCQPCNMAIGFFRDDGERMRNAAAYLEQTGSKPKPKPIRSSMARKRRHEFLDADDVQLLGECENSACGEPIPGELNTCKPCATYGDKHGKYPTVRTIAARRRQRWHREQAAAW